MFLIYLQLFIPLISLFINAIVQLLTFRLIPKSGLLSSIYLGFIVGFINLLIFEFYVFSVSFNDHICITIANLFIYFVLGYCYFNFICLGETARRIRILRELYDSKDGLSLEDLLKRYNAREIIEKRIERLKNNGQVISGNEKYYIGNNQAMLLIAKIIVLLKVVISGKRSEKT